jgi:hypothetical protein
MSLPSLFDFQSEILANGGKCISCGTEFKYGDINWYEHDGGIEVKESPGRPLWLFFDCRKCGYQSALWKVEKQLSLERETFGDEIEDEDKKVVSEEDEAWDRLMKDTEPLDKPDCLEDYEEFVQEAQKEKIEELYGDDEEWETESVSVSETEKENQ